MGQAHIIVLNAEEFDPAALEPAARALREGGLVAVPTETVYGIAVNRNQPDSVQRLLRLRGSPQEKHLTVHIGDRDDLPRVVPGTVPPAAQRLIRRFWPGPLTLVFPTPDQRGVGVRYPAHRVCCEILRRAGVQVVAPSANRSGESAAVTGEEVRQLFASELDVIVDAGAARLKTASTVVRVEGSAVEVLREGAIPRALIDGANLRTVLFVCTGNTCRSPMAEALFRKMLADRLGVEPGALASRGWRVHSAGTAASLGLPASEEAEAAVGEQGADLSGHQTAAVSGAMVEDADHVFVMTARHKRVLDEWMPDQAAKIRLLDPQGADVGDPIGESLEMYRTFARRLRDLLDQRLGEMV